MDMAANEIMSANEIMAPSINANCQYSTRYCWEAEKVKSLIRLRAELSPLFTGKRNASKYAWAVVERELNVPLPLSKIIKKWNNLLQEYKAIKMSEEPKRREWPFFTLMDVYFSDQVNDPSLRLFSSTKTLKETIDDSVFEDDPIIASAIAAATSGAYMDIDELIRRQKERAANDKKFTVGDFKYDIKPMLPNSKFNSNDMVKLSKSVDDLNVQQYKLKDEILRQREHDQQENIVKIKQHARQQQQQQHHHHQRYHQQQQPPHSHRLQQPTSPPGLHVLQQQHLLHQQHQQHQQQNIQQHLHQQQLQPPPPPTPPTTAQQIHIQTAQHQAAQQQLHLQQQHQKHQQQFTDPNTIDQYLLSWNNFHGNMCRGFHTLQKDEKMVDVTIAAGGKIFKAHKLVLSVCSPYFQQIFLENPSSHPILLMADVEASHMAGLLDFMYSGQVNVKYEDLPVFLKVAEAMKIKGLHTEKNLDEDTKEVKSSHENESTECHFDRATHSVNITGSPYGQTHLQMQQHQTHQQSDQNGNNNTTKSNTNTNSNNNNNNNNSQLAIQGFNNFRDHIKSKATLAETFMKNLSRNNNNSNSNNFNHLGNSASNIAEPIKPDNYSILQANSNKILDSTRKQHKYLAKRKILMHYNEELNEKRMKEIDQVMEHDANNNNQRDSNIEAQSSMNNAPLQQNNFKIRISEGHHILNNNNNNINSNEDEEEEEEALNLVQNTNTHNNIKSVTKSDRDLTEHDQMDTEQKMPNAMGIANKLKEKKSNELKQLNDDDITHHKDYEYDDNKSNNTNRTTDKDNNNNENNSIKMSFNKNTAIISAINTRNVKFKDEVHDESYNWNKDSGHGNDNSNGTDLDNNGIDNINNDNIDDEDDRNNNDKNNNNHNQLNLSNPHAVKNIATAEILYGLKSKVFTMENEQRETCRTINEIKNAD